LRVIIFAPDPKEDYRVDWQTILASITASSVIAAAIGYVIKKSLTVLLISGSSD